MNKSYMVKINMTVPVVSHQFNDSNTLVTRPDLKVVYFYVHFGCVLPAGGGMDHDVPPFRCSIPSLEVTSLE
jgi:hypothetical protein